MQWIIWYEQYIFASNIFCQEWAKLLSGITRTKNLSFTKRQKQTNSICGTKSMNSKLANQTNFLCADIAITHKHLSPVDIFKHLDCLYVGATIHYFNGFETFDTVGNRECLRSGRCFRSGQGSNCWIVISIHSLEPSTIPSALASLFPSR